MKSNRLTAVLAPVVVAVALGAGLAAGAGAQSLDAPCLDTAADYLNGLGIKADDVKEINVVRVIQQYEVGNTVELQAWASLNSCSGNLVVKMSPHCSVKEVYSRGGCSVDNVRHF